MRTIEQNWHDYRNACYGNNPIHNIQDRETRQAYYSGFLTALSTLAVIADTLPEDAAVEQLAALTKEATSYIEVKL